MVVATVALAVFTMLLKGAGVVAGRLPTWFETRAAGLAPALLAALVVSELLDGPGRPAFDAKTAGVMAAVVAATLRAPLAVCVVAGATAAALLRALT